MYYFLQHFLKIPSFNKIKEQMKWTATVSNNNYLNSSLAYRYIQH